MKKIIFLGLVFVLLISLNACKGSSANPESGSKAATSDKNESSSASSNQMSSETSSGSESTSSDAIVPQDSSKPAKQLKNVLALYDKPYDEFRFYAYMTPPPANVNSYGNPDYINDEQYRYMSECGFNYGVAIYEEQPADILRALKLSEKYNIKYYVLERSIVNAVVGQPMKALSEGFKTNLVRRLDKYVSYKSFAGVHAADEIGANAFGNAGLVANLFDKLYPGKDFYINLVGTNAGLEYMQSESYVEYYEKYIKATNSKLLSYDNYALIGMRKDLWSIRGAHLRNMEIAIQVAQKAKIPFYNFILGMGHEYFRTPNNYADMAWQIYSSMAYGAKGVEPFSYWTTMDKSDSSITYGLINQQGERTPCYYAMQSVTNEVKAMEKVYMQLNYVGTIPFQKDEEIIHMTMSVLKNELTEHSRIANYTSTQDMLIGCFKDRNQNDAFMITNYADPGYELSSDVTIRFNNASQLLVMSGGQVELISLNDGVFNKTLKAGQGCLVVPVA